MNLDFNICLLSDSYKVGHRQQYPADTKRVYSYCEARKGGLFDHCVFFGLQYVLKSSLEGVVVTREKLDEADRILTAHLGKPFDRSGWEHILEKHGGKLPLVIKAIPEGTVVPESNILMSVENTDEECYWLTNFVESVLLHVWYSCTVATLSLNVRRVNERMLEATGCSLKAAEFMLHDFGYRGASSNESAAIGGLSHLVIHKGTDTLPALKLGIDFYRADVNSVGFSVTATEHSVMTARGEEGESQVVGQLLKDNPEGILSVVADSYDIYRHVSDYLGKTHKQAILDRNGVYVVRPDSTSDRHTTPEAMTLWIVEQLGQDFGFTENAAGYKTIHSKIRVLWGDGIDASGIAEILQHLADHGWAADNMAAFGMGGGLLQKVNRDTLRFAFKSSAQERSDGWHDIAKRPTDLAKASKSGRLKLIRDGERYVTVTQSQEGEDCLIEVFRDGVLLVDQAFEEIRKRARS